VTVRSSGLGWPAPAPPDPSAQPATGPATGLGWPDKPAPAATRAGDSEHEEPGPQPPSPETVPVVPTPRPACLPAEAEQVSRETTRPVARRVLRRLLPTLPRPAESRVIAVANQKGGVGKTTSVVNLAAALAMHGASVLVVDLDPQGNASTALGLDRHVQCPSVYEVLLDGMPMAEAVTPVEAVDGLLCVPATIDLAGAEIELVPLVARESRLQRALRTYLQARAGAAAPQLDYVLLDCPPSLGLLTVNALAAAREVLIPIQCEYYALEGLGQLLRNVDLVTAHLNPDLVVSTILLTMYDARTRLSTQVAEEVRNHFPDVVLRTTIPRSIRITEAPSYGQTVLTYDPGSSGALSYLEAARELARAGAPGVTRTGERAEVRR
jgi:chromosome partitioning protein